MELELKHIQNYLSKRLNVLDKNNNICQIVGWMGSNPFYEVKDPECSLDCEIFKVMYLENPNKPNYDFADWGISQIKPELRPMSDLCEPCLDGCKIPIVELAKIANKDYKNINWDTSKIKITEDEIIVEVNDDLDDKYLAVVFGVKTKTFNTEQIKGYLAASNHIVEIIDFLDENHFDWRYNLIEKGLAIDINTIEK